MEKLPIPSKAQVLVENEMMNNVQNPADILPLMNRWLKEYSDIMSEEFNQLHLVTQKSFETKYLIAQRISLLCEKSKRLFQIIERNRAASSTSSQTTNTDDTGSISSQLQIIERNHAASSTSSQTTNTDDSGSTSSGSSTSESALPNIVASPKPADQLNDDVPSTSRSCYTTPTRWSIGSIKTVHRITYENPYCADPRKRVLREMNREANLNGTSTSTNIQCEDHAASSTGSSITTSTENFNDSIVDSGNNRNVLNYTEETQSTNSSSVAGSMPMPSPPTAENAVHCTVIGPNGTSVPTEKFNAISFMSSSAATRSLLCMIFPEKVLATNTLSGKSSPAFLGNDRVRPQKGQLDPKKVEDIMHCVMSRTSCSDKEVRLTITTKCADSTKKFRRLSKTPRRSSKIKIKINKLNIFRENKL